MSRVRVIACSARPCLRSSMTCRSNSGMSTMATLPCIEESTGRIKAYAYDALGRLTDVPGTRWEWPYSHDDWVSPHGEGSEYHFTQSYRRHGPRKDIGDSGQRDGCVGCDRAVPAGGLDDRSGRGDHRPMWVDCQSKRPAELLYVRLLLQWRRGTAHAHHETEAGVARVSRPVPSRTGGASAPARCTAPGSLDTREHAHGHTVARACAMLSNSAARTE